MLWFPRLLGYSFLPQHFFLPLKKGSDQPRASNDVEAMCLLLLASDLPLKLCFSGFKACLCSERPVSNQWLFVVVLCCPLLEYLGKVSTWSKADSEGASSLISYTSPVSSQSHK